MPIDRFARPALIVVEARLERLRDGSVWGNAAFAPAAWQRHLDVFPGLLVAARVSRVSAPSPGSVRVDVPGVIDVVELPDYVGLSGLIREMPRVRTLRQRLTIQMRKSSLAEPVNSKGFSTGANSTSVSTAYFPVALVLDL